MPQIGWFEILIVVGIAIVVIGPKDFPVMLKRIGSWIGSIKRTVNSFQNQITELENTEIDNDSDQNKKSTDINKNTNEQ
tara:strand:+ start:136 stop:372 length:237 start_codon:yes stop_codon:yes gene_type:complete